MKTLPLFFAVLVFTGCHDRAAESQLKKEAETARHAAMVATNELLFANLRADIAESECRMLSNSLLSLTNKCADCDVTISNYEQRIRVFKDVVKELNDHLTDSRYQISQMKSWNESVRQTMAAQEVSRQQGIQQAKIDEENRRVQADEAARQQSLQTERMKARAALIQALNPPVILGH